MKFFARGSFLEMDIRESLQQVLQLSREYLPDSCKLWSQSSQKIIYLLIVHKTCSMYDFDKVPSVVRLRWIFRLLLLVDSQFMSTSFFHALIHSDIVCDDDDDMISRCDNSARCVVERKKNTDARTHAHIVHSFFHSFTRSQYWNLSTEAKRIFISLSLCVCAWIGSVWLLKVLQHNLNAIKDSYRKQQAQERQQRKNVLSASTNNKAHTHTYAVLIHHPYVRPDSICIRYGMAEFKQEPFRVFRLNNATHTLASVNRHAHTQRDPHTYYSHTQTHSSPCQHTYLYSLLFCLFIQIKYLTGRTPRHTSTFYISPFCSLCVPLNTNIKF